MLDILLQDPAPNYWGEAFNLVGAFAGAGILGMAKRTDAKIFRSPVFRKAQPFITLAASVAAPYVAQLASSHVDISGLGQAPMATLMAVVGAEFLAMLKRSV